MKVYKNSTRKRTAEWATRKSKVTCKKALQRKAEKYLNQRNLILAYA